MGGSPLPTYDDGDGDRMAWGCKLDWFWNTVSYCSSTYEVSTEFCVFASENYISGHHLVHMGSCDCETGGNLIIA